MITSLDKNTALVLIDLQVGIVAMPSADQVQGVVENAAALVTAFRKAGQPVVFVKIDFSKGAALSKLRKDEKPRSMDITPDWFDIVPELQVEEGDIVVTKNIWNAFTNPELHKQLQERGVTGIVLAGVSTSIGVEGTARAASELGYNLTFALDATADTNDEAFSHTATRILPRLGEVGTTADVIAKL
jgi:nicotinamidase-related amidase